jgi:SNF2 family DNA or RNA helicase
MSLLSSHTSEDRRRIIAQFNDPNHKVDVLLIGFKLGSYGLNFHGCCCKMIIMEYPSSIDILLHVFGRLHRLGQKKEQEIIIFFLEDSFDGKLRSFIGSKFNSKLSAEADLGHITDDKLLEEADKLLRRLLGED